MKAKRLSKQEMSTLEFLIHEGIVTDGDHHKMWVLEEIASILCIETPEHEPGIPPETIDLGEWEGAVDCRMLN